MNKPTSKITGSLASLDDAVRQVPRRAYSLMVASVRTNKALDMLIGNSRLVRWLPFRIVSVRDLNKLVAAIGRTHVTAEAVAVVGYEIASRDISITNPWEDKDGTKDIDQE